MIFLLCLAQLWLYPFFEFFPDNPDAIAYLNIARQLKAGNVAVLGNGYWSPLLPLITAPLINMSLDVVWIVRTVQLFISVGVLYQLILLIKNFQLGPIANVMSLSVGWLVVLNISLYTFSPDLLFVGAVLYYLNLMVKIKNPENSFYGWRIGLAASIMFFTKATGLMFFAGHFLVMNILWYKMHCAYYFKHHQIRNFLAAILTAIILCGGFVAFQSGIQQKFVYSYAANFNLSKEVSPGVKPVVFLPIINGGLLNPSNEHVCAWESPHSYTTITPSAPWNNLTDFNLWVNTVKRNLMSIYYADFNRQAGLVWLIVIFIFTLFFKNKIAKNETVLVNCMLAIIMLYVGYSLILVHERYLWVCRLLILSTSMAMAENLLQGKRMFRLAGLLLGVLLVSLTVKKNYKELLLGADRDVSLVTLFKNPAKILTESYHTERANWHAIKLASNNYTFQFEHFATIHCNDKYPFHYTDHALLAFLTKGQYVGNSLATSNCLNETLRAKKVKYIITQGDCVDGYNQQIVFADINSGLRILQISP
ncbi:MAG: hypothetical protein RIQ89_2390 [Bacteroidota bacterium]